MKTPEQVKWDFVQQWLSKASQDLSAAEALLKAQFESYDAVGFHAQQAVEKLMKAFLVRHQIEFPKTHNISLLRGLLAKKDEALSEKLLCAESLTEYGVEYRYPGVYDAISSDKAKETLRLAKVASGEILSTLESYLISGRPGNKP